jgi:predicted methyltransferase
MAVMKTWPRVVLLVGVLVVAARSGLASGAGVGEEQSVRPGINEKFLDPDLKVDEWLKRFEVESREVFTQRKAVVAACRIREGMTVGDIGAGTGLYTRLFSQATGPKGWVYAVEINGRFLEHINARARQEGQKNITPVLSPENAVALPADSLDLAFVCDTYHHFEYPAGTMASIARALKKGGTLVVIDFERIPGKSREWTIGHVRAGKEVFKKEIEAAGLVFVEELNIAGFKENYFLRFRKE